MREGACHSHERTVVSPALIKQHCSAAIPFRNSSRAGVWSLELLHFYFAFQDSFSLGHNSSNYPKVNYRIRVLKTVIFSVFNMTVCTGQCFVNVLIVLQNVVLMLTN